MALTIGAALCLLILGAVGVARGIRRGLVALAGTLLGAVLVDLWQERWLDWMLATFAPERPALPGFLLIAALFLAVAGFVGYGGGSLLPAAKPIANTALDRGLGGMLGAINAALISGYLLRYAGEIWPSGTLAAILRDSLPATILAMWLPWFMLALVGTTAIFVLLRLTMRISRMAGARQSAARAAGASKPAAPASSPTPSIAAAGSLREADQQLNEKINQRLGR